MTWRKGRTAALTYMLLCNAADVPDVHDLPLVPHHAHRDGVLTHLRGDVAVHLNAQVLQHQKPCTSQQKAESLGHLPGTLVFAGGPCGQPDTWVRVRPKPHPAQKAAWKLPGQIGIISNKDIEAVTVEAVSCLIGSIQKTFQEGHSRAFWNEGRTTVDSRVGFPLLFLYTGPSLALNITLQFSHPTILNVNTACSKKVSLMPTPFIPWPPGWPSRLCEPPTLGHPLHLRGPRMPDPALLLGLQGRVGGLIECASS